MILLSKSVICRKPPQRRIIMPCTVVIPVQPFLRIKLLAVILVRLHIACTCKHTTERIVMVRLLYSAALVDDYPVVTLMVFQVVMILAVAQSNIAFIGQQQLLNIVLIDHVSAIVRRGSSAACLMDSFQLRAVGTVCMTYPTAVTESHRTWQI